MLDIKKIREEFPILAREVYGYPLVYLDNAATAQKPLKVIERIDWMHRNLNANIHRGVHYLSQECTEAYEDARKNVRAFINAPTPEEIVFTSGATASINLVAYSFGQKFIGKGDNVVITAMEHHSNIVPWQLICDIKGAQIRVLPFDENGRLEEEKLEGIIDGRTRIVAATQASNVLGTRPDLKRIIATAHSRGVPVLVDGCQGVVHGSVDVTDLDCDFYAFSAHKLYGPTGVGVLYAKRKWLEEMPPFMGGGEMVQTVSLEGTTYADVPLKFEAGTANFIGAVGLSAAIDWLRGFDSRQVELHERALLDYATGRLDSLGGITIHGTMPGKCPIISFTTEGVHHYDLGMVLDKLGIAVRTGTHCAELTMQSCSVDGMCRASFAIYNTMEEVDVLIEGVKKAITMLRK